MAPKGPRLPNPEQGIRDALMMERRAQGWTWAEVAEEAGITVGAAKKAVKVRREVVPGFMEMEPVAIIDYMVQGHVQALANYQRLAAKYAVSHPAAAIGALKGAAGERRQLLILLQATGNLPRELGTLRIVMQIEAAVKVMGEALEDAEQAIEREVKDLDPKKREAILAAAREPGERLSRAFGLPSAG